MNELLDTGSIISVYTFNEVFINLIISFFLGLYISWIYKVTHKGLSYSQSFMITNIFVCMIVCMVIMIIGNSLVRAFALVGALSIIRFRTVVKDTKDTSFIFWSLAAGMAAGTSNYMIAATGTGIISFIAYTLLKVNYGSIYKSEFILQCRLMLADEKKDDYIKILNEYSKSCTLLNSEISGDKTSTKLTYDVILKDDEEQNDLIISLSKINYISEINLIASKSDIDY